MQRFLLSSLAALLVLGGPPLAAAPAAPAKGTIVGPAKSFPSALELDLTGGSAHRNDVFSVYHGTKALGDVIVIVVAGPKLTVLRLEGSQIMANGDRAVYNHHQEPKRMLVHPSVLPPPPKPK